MQNDNHWLFYKFSIEGKAGVIKSFFNAILLSAHVSAMLRLWSHFVTKHFSHAKSQLGRIKLILCNCSLIFSSDDIMLMRLCADDDAGDRTSFKADVYPQKISTGLFFLLGPCWWSSCEQSWLVIERSWVQFWQPPDFFLRRTCRFKICSASGFLEKCYLKDTFGRLLQLAQINLDPILWRKLQRKFTQYLN